MKKLVISFFLGLVSLFQISAQGKFYEWTMQFGVSPKQTPLQADLFVNRQDPMNELILNLGEIERYYQVGISKNIRLSRPFFGTLGLNYSLQKTKFEYTYTYKEPIAGDTQSLHIKSHILTLPAGVGVRFGSFDVTSGLQMQYAFKSEMKDSYSSGIEMTPSKINLGWYTGVGYSFGRTRVGVQYQSSMNRYGENLRSSGQSLALRSVPGNFTFTLGFSF